MKLSTAATVTLAALLSTSLFSATVSSAPQSSAPQSSAPLLAQEGSVTKPAIEIAPRTPHAAPKPTDRAKGAPVPDETASEATVSTPSSPSAGMGRPPLVIPATTATQKIRLRLAVPGPFEADDLELGLLANAASPDLRITPRFIAVSVPAQQKDGETVVDATVSGLIPFGDSSAPILYKGQQIDTLRVHKAGLAVALSAEETLVARQRDNTMLLVVENPSEFDYHGISARIRFQGVDSCGASSDKPGVKSAVSGSCDDASQWHRFDAPKFSRVSLRVQTPQGWFHDPDSGIARSGTRKGTLTLRYPAADSQPSQAFEQNLALESRFDPSTWSLTKSFGWIGSLLVAGALLSLALRVSIPNFRRKKVLKDQLDEARRAIAEISDQVNSQLRVVLRVERLALDQRRRDGWVLLPTFAETAALVEVGLAILKRKISLVQRLDASANRQEVMLDGPVSPTRLDIIERNLGAACEGLKADQLNEADWILIQQHLEAADKALNEPTQEEKQAFEALLSRRWKAIRDHFGRDENGELIVPKNLAPMADCLPVASLLPKADDADGMTWIDSMGFVRADLQITALELVRDVQFLAPTTDKNAQWSDAIQRFNKWLATPALGNLRAARTQLAQLAEGICPEDIVTALQNEDGEIETDPQFVNPNQTVRVAVRFRDSRFNTAAARAAIQCEWQFYQPKMSTYWQGNKEPGDAAAAAATPPPPPVAPALEQREIGWKVHRYFEPGIAAQKVETLFFYKGQPVMTPLGTERVRFRCLIRPRERTHHVRERRESYWRILPQVLQLSAALLVPLAALTLSTANGAASGQWWELVGLGFGSETIRNILAGSQSTPPTA